MQVQELVQTDGRYHLSKPVTAAGLPLVCEDDVGEGVNPYIAMQKIKFFSSLVLYQKGFVE